MLFQFLTDNHAVRTYDTLSLSCVMQYSLILTDFNLICFQLYIKIYTTNFKLTPASHLTQQPSYLNSQVILKLLILKLN